MSTPGPVALRPLAALTALVVIVHLLVLQAAPSSLNFGDAPTGRMPALTTRTLAPPASPAAAPLAAPAAPGVPPRAPAAAQRPPRSAPAPQTASQTPDAESNPALPSVEGSEKAINSIAISTPTSPVGDAPAVAAETTLSVPASPPASGVTLRATVPPSVRLRYEVSGEVRQLPYGANAELRWRHDGQHYEARLEVSAFLLGARVQTSEGDITPQGLAPRRFGDKSRSEQAAHFNRESQRISFSANTPDAPLLPGAQDRLSLFLQLGALLAADPKQLAPGTSLTLQTVGARDAEPWLITAGGEERLRLPGGELLALKFTRAPRREFDTRVELWLAPSLNYLPVRIRLTQANGDFADQQMRSTEPLDDLK